MRTRSDKPPRSAASRRLGPIAFSATCVAAYMLTLVYHDAAAPLPGNPAAQAMAQAALNELGYTWAQAKISGSTIHIEGKAPRDGDRVIAYVAVRRALRPLMGKDHSIVSVVSHVTTSEQLESGEARQSAGQTIDAANLLPPPAPRVHPGATGSITAAASDTAPAQGESPRPAAAHFQPSAGDAAEDADAAIETPPDTGEDANAAPPPALPQNRAEAAQGPPPEPVAIGNSPETITTAAARPDIATEPIRHDDPAERANVPPEPIHEAPLAQTQAAANIPALEAASGPRTQAAPVAAAQIVTAALDTPPPTAASVPVTAAAACKVAFAQALSATKIEFARDSATIQKESRPLLDKLASIARRCSAFRFTVEGHSDLTGSQAHNLALSLKRAEAVRWALIDRGIDMDHISAEGLGASRPLEQGTSEAANARNRRIAVSVQEPVSARQKADNR